MTREFFSKPHKGAYERGRKDFLAGKTEGACPYHDIRRDDGKITGSRGFRRAWFQGWADAKAEHEAKT